MSTYERLKAIERSIEPQPFYKGGCYISDFIPPANRKDVIWLIQEVRRLMADGDYCATYFSEHSRGAADFRAGKKLSDNPHIPDRSNSLFDDAWQEGWKSAAYDSAKAEAERPCVHELAKRYAESCGGRFDDAMLDQIARDEEIKDVVLEDDRSQ